MPEIENLYSVVKDNGLYTKSYDEFVSKYSNEQNMSKLYQVVYDQGLYTKSFDDFKGKYFTQVKKKESVSPSQQKAQPTSLVTGAMGPDGEPVSSASSSNKSSVPLWLQKQETPKPQATEESLPFMVPKPQGINLGSERVPEKGPMFGVGKPEFKEPEKIDKNLARLETSLVDMDEDQATEKLKYLFGDLGFTFDQAGYGYDAITVTSPSGKKLDLSWDNFSSKQDEYVLGQLTDFISKESKAPSNAAKLEKYYEESNKKFVDQREINETIATLSKKSDDVNKLIKGYVVKRDALENEGKVLEETPENLRDANWESRYNKFVENVNKLEEERLSVVDYQNNFEGNKSDIDMAVGKYMQTEEKMGWWGGVLLDSFLKGQGRVAASGTALFIDGIVNIMPTESLTGDYPERFVDAAKKLGYKVEDYKKLKTSLSEDQIEEINDKVDDELKKELKYKYGTLETARETNVKVLGSDNVTKQYEAKFKEGFFGGAVAGLAESLPSMLGPSPARVLSMYSNITDNVSEEMENDPTLSKLSETEKSLVSVPIGIVSAVLEEFGLRNVVANKGLLNKLVMRMLGKVSPGVTSRTFAELVRNDVESMVARGLLTVGGGALAEFETGAAQEASEQTIKAIYNKVKGDDVFKQIAQTPYEFIGDMMYAGAQEAVGGFVLGSIPAVSAAYRKTGFEGMSDIDFEKFERIANDDKVESAFVTSLKTQINSGEISVEDAKQTLNDYRKSRGLYKQLPDSLTTENKKKAMNLLRERQGLDQQISGKDAALVKTQKARIEEINSLLETISKPENNAVQEQATSEVPVQPGAAVSGEVAQGEPQAEPQVVTEEGQSQEEVAQYIADLQETKQSDPEQYWSVDSVTEEAAKEGTVISDEDGGVVVSKEGDIKGLFKKIGSKAKGVAQKLLQKAIDAGGIKLDNFDNYLTPIYEKAGFRVVSRVPFNEEYAPEGWNKEKHGTPDVVAMVYDPENKLDIQEQKFDDYDQAMAYRDQFIPQVQEAYPVQQQSEFDQAVANSAQSLKVVAPDLKIIVAENTEDAQLQIAEALSAVAPTQATDVAEGFTTETRGQTVFVNGKPFAIVLDKSQADSKTVGHEAWELMLNDAFGDDQAKFKEFRDEIDRQLRLNGYGEIADALTKFSNQRGYEDVKYSEYMAELGGMLVADGFKKGSLDAKQKSLLQKIGDVINKFAQLFTGKKQFLDEATPDDILGFMITISNKVAKGEDVSQFFRGKESAAKPSVETRSQRAAIEILDGPKFDNKLKEDVASYLNSLRDSEIPPNSSREELMERFINNVYEEVGYYLYSKPDARSAGLTWYIEDMVEFANKVKVVLPALSDENQYKLFLTVLAFTSSGTNPNQNLLYAYNLWNNSNDPKNFEFSKNWAEKKLSFIDKKGKPVASGVIVKETAKEYTVELVDSLGRTVVDKKGNKKYEKVSKASMKPGYPKPTGYTNRGEIIVGQLEKLEKLYADLGSIDAVVKWLETPHPIAELRKYNESVPDVNGKGPGKTNKEYDPKKNAEGERNGAFIFGEKIGSFYQNMIGIGETITMDLWWSRTWNRYMGTMINTVSGKKEIQEVPRSDRERNIMREAVKMVAEDLNLQVSELQAAIWYFEQELWTKSGNESPSYSYVTAIDDLTKKLKVDEETRTKLRAAEADLTEAEKRRQNAAERAAAVVASKGGELPKVKVTTKSQKSVPAVVDEVLTDDGKGNYVFVHYSDELRDTIKPMSGSKKNFTSREEVSAISAVGGVAMYYTKQGQVESGVGNVPHTVLVPKDKVYFYGSTEKGTVSHDPEGFEEEARQRFQAYRNRGNEDRPTKYAFDANNSAAWVTKVAAENGYDMLVTNWGGPKSYRAQTTKELKPETDYTGFKQIPEPTYEVGDEIFLYGRYATVVAVDGNTLSYESPNDFGRFDSGKFTLSPYTSNKIMLIEKAKPTVTTKSQKVVVNTIPGYERMMGEVEGILDKTMNRTGSYNQATANAVGYIQKSAVYERADDSQREQIIRDFVKLRGEKFKVAPSVDKILGQIKDTKKVTVNEKTALKDQIKLEAKAAKDAVAFVKQLRMQISNTLRGMAGRGVISAKQASTILARYDRMNILNPDMRDRFVDYMANVFQSAEYADKVKEATRLRKTIRKAAKNPDNQAESSKLAKTFAEIDPSRVENIDDYLNNAEQILKSVSRKTGDVKMRSLVNMTDMVSYIDKEIQAQREQIKNEILSKYQDLVDAGVLDSKMTINEIQKVVEAIEEKKDESVAKAKEAKEAVKQMMDEVSPILLQIARTGEDPFTGDPIDLTPDEKRDLVKLAKMDLDSLSLADALKAVEYANNFISNGIFSGIGAIVSINEGSLEPAKLKKEGVMSLRLRKYFSPGAGRKWAEQLGTLTMLNKLLFVSNEKAIMVANASGESGIANGKAKAIKIVEKAVKEYTDKFSSLKDFRTGENIIERGILAFVSRTVIGDKFQVQKEFNRRKRLVEETIQALTDPNNSTDADIKKGELIEKVYDKILKDAKNVNDVRAKVSDVNKKAVDWWVNEWSKHYDRMDEVSRSVYNTLLTRDANFTPDRFQSIDLTTASENDFDSSFFSSFENVSTEKSGSLKENKGIENLPSDKNGVKTRIVNLDFDMNNANALTNALIDVETASSVLKAKGFVTSKDFGKIFSSKDDAKLYKRRLIAYVNNVRGKNYVDQSELTNMGKALNAIGSFGTAKALFSLSQPLKQSIPPLFNTLVQTRRLDLGTLFSGGSAFIDRTGYPIINRGISSLAELQAINKKIAEAEKNLLAKGIMGIAEYNNKMLELWLQKPDVFTARSSWLSFYINSLKKQGVNTKGIDWNTHEVNKKAADYAELMVSSQQNVNDSDMQGMLFTDKTPYAKAVRKALFTLMTFTLNQKTRIWSDMRTLSNKKLTSEADRKEALLSLSGAIVELVSFHSISLGVSYIVLQPLIDAMMEALGYEDDEEDKELEKKKLLMNKSASIAQSFLKDFILPPTPIVDTWASGKVNEIMDEYGISEKIAVEGFGIEDGESKFKLYDKEDYSFLDVLGGAGIAAEKSKELFDFSVLASTGKFDVETRGGLITKQILEENEDLAKINASIMSAYYLGILPGELAYIARKLDKKIKKGAERVEEEED